LVRQIKLFFTIKAIIIRDFHLNKNIIIPKTIKDEIFITINEIKRVMFAGLDKEKLLQ